MKLAARSWQIFWDVHAWAGAVAALALTVMFFAGVPTLYRAELAAWQEPGRPHEAHPGGPPPRLGPAFERLVRDKALAGRPRVLFRLREGGEPIFDWTDAAGVRRLERLDLAAGTTTPPRSHLADFLYELHFLNVVPNGLYAAGLCAVALGLALATGVLIHLKDLIRQAFQFRPQKRARTWAGDAHKVLGVFGLPFQALFAWSGAVLCLAYVTVEPALVALVFGGDEAAASAAHGYAPDPPPAAGRPGPLPDLDALVARAEARVPGLRAAYVTVHHVADAASSVRVSGEVEGEPFASGEVTYAASDGSELAVHGPSTAPPLARFEQWLFGLHFAHFGGGALKALYALLALATCAVLITGNVVWLERRDRARARAGNRVLGRLTAGVGAGLPLATAALFAANRLLPPSLADRAAVEQGAFWAAWLVGLALPFARRGDGRAAAASLLAAGGLFGLAAATDLTTRALARALDAGAGVDVGLLFGAAACAVVGVGLRRAAGQAGATSGRGAALAAGE